MSVEGLANILLEEEPGITFTVLEIGARQIPGATDIEHLHIMENFPGSSYIGFEVDEDSCEEMNSFNKPGYRYYAQAIGGANGAVPFYNTANAQCS